MDIFRGHRNHGKIDPRYGAAMVGYSAYSESHATKSQQVVEYSGPAGRPYKEVEGQLHKLLQPAWNSSAHDRHKKTGKLSPRVRPWSNVHVGNSPPSKNHSGKYDDYSSDESDDDDDDDDVVCDENGYCYPKPKHDEGHAHNYGHNPNKPSGNGHTTPPHQQPYYPAPPHQQPYYEVPNPNGYGYPAPPPHDPYYEKNKAVVHKPLPSVKTKRPNKATLESQVENMRINSPRSSGGQRSPFATSPKSHASSPRSPYSSSPLKDPRYIEPYSSSPLKDQGYGETIDSAEARRRYGGATVGAPVEQYRGTINSEEAARRYKGIYVKD